MIGKKWNILDAIKYLNYKGDVNKLQITCEAHKASININGNTTTFHIDEGKVIAIK